MPLIKTSLTKYLIKASDFSQFQKNGSKYGEKSVFPHTNVEEAAKTICVTACIGLTRMKIHCLCYKSMLHFCFRKCNGAGGQGEIHLSRAVKKGSSQEEGKQSRKREAT